MSDRETWSDAKLAYTAVQRNQIMACIQRLNGREQEALKAATIRIGSQELPRPHVREELRTWFRARWMYLVGEYEKVLPRVDEVPPR